MKSERMPLTAEEQQKLQRRLRRIAGRYAAAVETASSTAIIALVQRYMKQGCA